MDDRYGADVLAPGFTYLSTTAPATVPAMRGTVSSSWSGSAGGSSGRLTDSSDPHPGVEATRSSPSSAETRSAIGRRESS